MTAKNSIQIYSGEGGQAEAPSFEQSEFAESPEQYIAKKGLSHAVSTAVWLGQPLLVTGEPGTGKTQLAYSVANELRKNGASLPLLRFNTKTTSTAKDLFYRYDSLRHFHDAQFSKAEKLPVESNINYEALGLAILLSLGENDPQRRAVNDFLPAYRDRYETRSVVLIDEIDKAPRDLPNDILNEIEEMKFEVKEIGAEFTAVKENRPIIIMTSNSEKNLPDAFLRRCIFYHIDFPEIEDLKRIVEKRLGAAKTGFSANLRENAISHFVKIREELKLKKKPATAELLSWIRILEEKELDPENPSPQARQALIFTYSILAKNHEDAKTIADRFGAGFTTENPVNQQDPDEPSERNNG